MANNLAIDSTQYSPTPSFQFCIGGGREPRTMKYRRQSGVNVSCAGWSRSVYVALLGMLALGILLSGWIWWLAARSPAIPFLSKTGTAEWILYPLVPDTRTRDAAEKATVFRRNWWLGTVPANAMLQVRAFGGCQITLNNTLVGATPRAGENWKKPTVYDVARLLHAGPNEISVVVTNSIGPPALCLSLKGDRWTLNSDETWQSSLCGAVWQAARLASAPMPIRKGNPLAEGERCSRSLINRLPTLLLFAGLSVVILCTVQYFRRSMNPQSTSETVGLSNAQANILIAVAAGLWIILFVHNLKLLPIVNGFDSVAHLRYIDFIRQRQALPLANQGWEMHQAPLYYLVCASILSVLDLATASDAGVVALRLFGLILGLVQLGLVFASLRLIFPDDARKQTAGLMLAAFTPVSLYMYHYVTNEILEATLVTASIYCCLRIFNTERAGVGVHVALGLCLGAALLSKITAFAVAPVILVTLVGRLLIQRRCNAKMWLRTVGLACLVCLVVSGWHYLRVWIHFGNILSGAYVPPAGLARWQDPGYSTAGYYARFGKALVAPLFSGFNGFADGLYSTFWGDGLCGGAPNPSTRPPWNYDLMTAGYLLAVLPTVAIVIGAVAMLITAIRWPRAEWFLLIGLAILMGVALIAYPLKLPHYGNVKAFFGMPALLPLCIFGAWGMDVLCRRWRITRVILWTGLGVWAMNSYASLWIDSRAPATEILLAREMADRGNGDAAVDMLQGVLKKHPQNAPAQILLAEQLGKMGRSAESLQQYETAWRGHQDDADCASAMAYVLAQQGQSSRAIVIAERVIRDAPDRPDILPLLGGLFAQQKQFDKAVAAYREALRITPGNADVHCNLGLVLEQAGRPQEAIGYYEQALRIKPDYPEAQNNLAWLLATVEPVVPEDAVKAVTLAERACELTRNQVPAYLDTLAAAYAAAGRFKDAIATAQKGIELAGSAGQPQVAEEIEAHRALYRSGRTYHQAGTVRESQAQ